MLKFEDALYFQNMGVDIFNIEDEFFNDICYPYSDNSSSDMILTDSVKDIFQNVSLCDEGSKYDSINLETNSSTCMCKLKEEINTKPEKANFQTYIMSAYLESNFGVIKCYNLVFSLKDNLKNIDFGFLVL